MKRLAAVAALGLGLVGCGAFAPEVTDTNPRPSSITGVEKINGDVWGGHKDESVTVFCNGADRVYLFDTHSGGGISVVETHERCKP